MRTLNNPVAKVRAQASTHSGTWWSALHINKDKSRNTQRKAPRGTELLVRDHSRVAACMCVQSCLGFCSKLHSRSHQTKVKNFCFFCQHYKHDSCFTTKLMVVCGVNLFRWFPVKIFATRVQTLGSDTKITASLWTMCQKGLDKSTKTLSESLPHVRNPITPFVKQWRPTWVWGVLSTSWSLTKIQPVEVTQYKAFSYFAKLTNLITVVKFLGSDLDQVSLVLWAVHLVSLRKGLDSTDFPDSQAWTQNMSLKVPKFFVSSEVKVKKCLFPAVNSYLIFIWL